MDTIPPREFMGLFDRMTRYINVKDCGTAEDITDRMNGRIKSIRRHAKDWGWTKRAKYNVKQIKKARDAGFGRRTIDEAIVRPTGKVALTLKYGRTKAKDILLNRHEKRMGHLVRQRRYRGSRSARLR